MKDAAIKKKIAAQVDSLEKEIASVNEYIFRNPEVCYEERKAAALLKEKLAGEGFKVAAPQAGLDTAFTASSGGAGKSPKVALIAEYDALPGMGHACGHNLIAASAFGAAAAVRRAAPGHPGQLLVIGTPAEEGGGGKIRMIKKGVFKNVDAALMAHPSNKTRVISRMYAIADMEFTFTGKAAHAAAFPAQGINALDAGVLFYNAVSAMRQQIRDEARVHGVFTHGGDAPNIIPERVVMEFYVRSTDRAYFEELRRKVVECARGAARAAGCKVSVKSKSHVYEPFYPSHPIGDAFRRNMEKLGVADEGFGEMEQIGSSDIGNLSQVVPTIHPEYAIGGRGDINHSRNFLKAVKSRKGFAAMIAMTKTLAMTAYDLLSDKALMAEAKAEFRGRSKRKT